MKNDVQVIRTACALGDTSNCGLSVHVENGKIIKITPGDSPGPIKRNPCARGLSVHHWAYHPDRLKYPLKRAGERGEGKWKRISWDEALDELAVRLKEIGKKYGPESIAWSPADFPLLRQGGFLRLLSLTKGTWIDNFSLGDIAGPNADVATFGWMFGTWYTGFLVQDLNPRLAILWGANPADTDPFTMRVIMEGKKKGCRTVTIDPRFTTTASRSDEYLPIRPGTDGALALGMMHVILEKGLEDKAFITEKTVGPLLVRTDNHHYLRTKDLGQETDGESFMVWDGTKGGAQRHDISGMRPELLGEYSIKGITCKPAFQLLLDLVKDYPPEKAARITDVPIETIRRIAVEYSTQKPAALYRGWGMARTFYGDLSARALNTLAAITGNVNTQRPSAFNLNRREFQMPAGPYQRLPTMMLYDAVTKGDPYPIKALCFSWRNFVDQSPNRKRVINELIPALELILVCDLFMTNTGKYADYVLPASSFLECTDLTESMAARYPYLQLQQKAIESLHESKSDFRIACELGRRMGFGEYFSKSEEDVIREVLDSSHPTMEGITFEKLKEAPVPAKPLERPPDRFKTPTGRIEFYVERLESFGQVLPVYNEPVEIGREEKEKISGLTLLTPHPKYRHHSTGGNVPELLKFDPEPLLEINLLDADSRNIMDGDVVSVSNARSRMKLKARVTEHIKPGVVSVSEGWTPEQYIEGHHNELISDRINPAQQSILGPNAAFYDVRVEVIKTD